MSYGESTDLIECPSCGTSNAILMTYSGFGPANRERETAECYNCGMTIASERCLGIYSGPSIAAIKARLAAPVTPPPSKK